MTVTPSEKVIDIELRCTKE